MLEVLSWGDSGWGDELARGFSVTLQLALLSFILGLVLGAVGAVAKLRGPRIVRVAAEFYTTVLRGVPELLVIFLIYYGGGAVVSVMLNVAGHDKFVDVNPFAAGVAALGLVQGAYATEVFRSAALAVPTGQIDAGRALGLHRLLIVRFVLLPVLVRLALPGLGNLWLALLKETALVSIIGLEDLIRMAAIGIGVTRLPFTFYGATALAYLTLAVISMGVLRSMERHLARGME